MVSAFLLLVTPISEAATFSSRDYPVGHLPTLIAVYDFNGDGKPDLAVLNDGGGTAHGTVSILLNNGNGTFQSARNYDAGSTTPTSLAVTDFGELRKSGMASEPIGESQARNKTRSR